jgi:hypothetical protein
MAGYCTIIAGYFTITAGYYGRQMEEKKTLPYPIA